MSGIVPEERASILHYEYNNPASLEEAFRTAGDDAPLGSEDIAFATQVIESAAKVLDKAHDFEEAIRRQDEMRQLAETDPLTELSNHRHFYDQLRTELQHAKDTSGSLAVVLLDLDRFKQVNEESGHARGDETLHSTGDALRKVVRTEDCVARLGGDDFAMIVRGADSGYSRDVAERSRAAVASR